MIFLLAATAIETSLIRDTLDGAATTRCGRYDVFTGNLHDQPVRLLHTGVGKVNAALATEALLTQQGPTAVILFGCGGAYPDRGLALGDVALASGEIYGDEGVMTPTGFLDMQAIGFPLCTTDASTYFNQLPLDTHLYDFAQNRLEPFLAPLGKSLVTGPFVTVSSCSGTDTAARALAQRTGGICENMEGAAVAQVCLQHEVPLLELRGISNLAEDRDFEKWNLPAAAELSQRCVLELLQGWSAMEQAR